MSDIRYAPPVQFALEPSGRLKTALIAAHGLALSAAWFSAAPLAGKVLLGLVIPVHLFLAVKNHHRQHHRIRYSTASGWNIDGEAVSILPSTVATPYAIWLHYQTLASAKKALLIVHDALPDAEFRRLIVKLKISAS
ncbi:MAG: protein YgfX [Gammaproteobacteria bacterium]